MVGNKSSRNSLFIYGKTIIIIRTWVPNSVTANTAIIYTYIYIYMRWTSSCVSLLAWVYIIRFYVYTYTIYVLCFVGTFGYTFGPAAPRSIPLIIYRDYYTTSPCWMSFNDYTTTRLVVCNPLSCIARYISFVRDAKHNNLFLYIST